MFLVLKYSTDISRRLGSYIPLTPRNRLTLENTYGVTSASGHLVFADKMSDPYAFGIQTGSENKELELLLASTLAVQL